MVLTASPRIALYALLGLLALSLVFGLSLTRQKFNQRVIAAARPLLTGDACLKNRYHELALAGRPRVEREAERILVTATLTSPSGPLHVRAECAAAGDVFNCKLVRSLDAGGHLYDLADCRELPSETALTR